MNGHRFEVDLPEEPLAAEADPDKVRQVFNILVENALRYSPEGGTVTVGARRNADRVEVRVVDDEVLTLIAMLSPNGWFMRTPST